MRTAKHNTQIIRTPEGIIFSMLLAGPMSRFLAWLIDLAIIALLSIIFAILCSILGLLALIAGPIGADMMAALFLAGVFLLNIGYAICLEWFWRGRTIGKRCLHLRVVDEYGLRLRFSQIVIRNLLRVADALPAFYLLGGLTMILSRHQQRLGDLAANTIVIRLPRLVAPNLNELLSEKYNSFRAQPHLAARLRQLVSPREAEIALQSLVRRDQFEPAARTELFRKFAEYFRAKLSFPEEACLGLSDEQYIRNVVDLIYRIRPDDDDAARSNTHAKPDPLPQKAL